MKKIGVIFGGNSVEHDISIITGVQTLNAVNKIEINDPPPLDATMELNLNDILNDLHDLDK